MLISGPAILFNGDVMFEGESYDSAEEIAHKLDFNGEFIKGFATDSGEFVLPARAAQIAFEADQIPEDKPVLELEDISDYVE